MKLKLIVCFFFAFFSTEKLAAQNYTFRVMGSKGSISVDGKPIELGNFLTEKQNIVMSKDAFLSLLHSNGKPLELKTKGSFKVKELASKVENNVIISNQYIDFVADELTKKDGHQVEIQRKAHTRKTGSVECGFSFDPVFVLMPNSWENSNDIFGDNMTLKFFLKPNSGRFCIESADLKFFKITIKDMTDEILFEKETTNNTEIVDLTKDKLANAKDLVIQIVPVKKDGTVVYKNSDTMISKLDEDEKKEISLELSKIIDSKAEATALSKLIEARFFEEKGFFLDAVTAYEKALELSDYLLAYQEMYRCFLVRSEYSFEKDMVFAK